jgi:hypothetical protein
MPHVGPAGFLIIWIMQQEHVCSLCARSELEYNPKYVEKAQKGALGTWHWGDMIDINGPDSQIGP